MTRLSLRPLTLMLVTTLALAACSEDRFGDSGIDGDGTGTGIGADGAGFGGPNDPTTVAYFNQTVGDRILFLVDQSTLTPIAQQVLQGQAEWLLANPEFTALIEGHADEQGTREYNLALGARRAAAVREFLVTQGVPDARLRTISYGKERPIEICSDEACYSQNRRAVTVLSAGAAS